MAQNAKTMKQALKKPKNKQKTAKTFFRQHLVVKSDVYMWGPRFPAACVS